MKGTRQSRRHAGSVHCDKAMVLESLKPVLENPVIGKIGQNIKYDAHIFYGEGIKMAGIAEDSMLQSYVLNSTATRHNMDDLAKFYLNRDTIHFEDIAGKGAKQIGFNQIELIKLLTTLRKTPTSPCNYSNVCRSASKMIPRY